MLKGRYEVRVLEPSPPAVNEGPWFADDPVARGGVPAGCRLVAPVRYPGGGAEDLTWDELCAAQADPHLSAWCADRWLGAWMPLAPLPASYPETRLALHAVAEHVLAAVRHQGAGQLGLRYTRGGFGTPFMGRDRQVRVEADELVVQDATLEIRAPLLTLAGAATMAGVEPGPPHPAYAPATAPEPLAPLPVDLYASRVLGDWFGFCASVLEQIRIESSAPARAELWPSSFALTVDIGGVTLGGSPGDATFAEPYLFVSGHAGPAGRAQLGYAELRVATDQRGMALDFLRRQRSGLSKTLAQR